MKIHPQDIGQIYAAYVDAEIGPKATTALQKFWAYGSAFAIDKQAQIYLADPDRVKQLTAMGIMTADGFIDMDFLREMCAHAIDKCGGKLEAMGLILDKSDVEKVYNIGRAYAR